MRCTCCFILLLLQKRSCFQKTGGKSLFRDGHFQAVYLDLHLISVCSTLVIFCLWDALHPHCSIGIQTMYSSLFFGASSTGNKIITSVSFSSPFTQLHVKWHQCFIGNINVHVASFQTLIYLCAHGFFCFKHYISTGGKNRNPILKCF